MAKGVTLRFKGVNAAQPAMNSFNDGLRNVNDNIQRTRVSMNGMANANRSLMRGLSDNRRIIQNVGFQVSDLAVQIGGGQSAALAFTQQVPQIVQMFGAWGAVLAGLITVMGVFAIVLGKTGTGMKDVLPIAGVLREDFEKLMKVVDRLKETFFSFANLIINNFDTVVIAATVMVGYFSTSWIVTMVAAKGAVSTLIGALIVLRKVMITTGIGALIIGVSVLIERFIALSQTLGSTGEAFKLVSAVAQEQIGKIPEYWNAGLFMIEAGLFKMLEVVQRGFVAVSTWFATEFVNGMILGVQKMINGTVSLLNNLPGINLGFVDFTNSFREIEQDGVLDRTLDRIRQMANESRDNAKARTEWSRAIVKGATDTSPALQKLIEQLSSIKEQKFDIRDFFKTGEDKDKIEKELTDIERMFQNAGKSIAETMRASFKSVIQGTESLGEALLNVLDQILNKIFEIATQPLVNGISNAVTGGLQRALGGIVGGAGTPATPNANALPSFHSGGSTGRGVHAGGIDGQGGFLAVLRGRERVVPEGTQDSSGVTVNMTVVANDVESFRKSKRSIMREMSTAMRAVAV